MEGECRDGEPAPVGHTSALPADSEATATALPEPHSDMDETSAALTADVTATLPGAAPTHGTDTSTTGGDPPVDIDALRQEWELMQHLHEQQLKDIDRVACALRASEMALVDLVVRDREAEEENDARISQGELRRATVEAEQNHLAAELLHLQRELLDSAAEVRHEESRMLSATNLLARVEKRQHTDALLSSTSAPSVDEASEALSRYTGLEDHLRTLEDNILNLDNLLEDRTRALEKLREAHSSLADLTKVQCGTAQEELAESRKVAEHLQRTYSKLAMRREDAEARSAHLRSRVARLGDSQSDMEGTRSLLEETLRRNQALNRVAENELFLYVNQIIGEEGSDLRFDQLETAMNHLMGEAVNIANDYHFIGEVQQEYAPLVPATAASVYYTTTHTESLLAIYEAPVLGMKAALNFIRDYLAATHGNQSASDRWIMHYAREPSYDEVEGLLTALKQLPICYDILPEAVRRNLSMSRELVRNSENLLHLTRVCTSKYKEALESRAARDEEIRREREERVRKAIAPKLPQSHTPDAKARKARVKVPVRRHSSLYLG